MDYVLSGSLLPAVGHKILSNKFSPQGICQFDSFNTMEEFI